MASLVARQFVVVCLMLSLALSGAGRVVMAVQAQSDMTTVVIAGYTVQVCVTDDDTEKGTGSGHQQTCDQCPLCAPTLLPDPPAIARAAAVVRLASLAPLPVKAPDIAGTRSPRQSQGPPVA
ncbi:hypothetical protein ACMDCR_05585 [Labrys okinawensis]|uniref:hypothetical protein n=1 Tax=Labrys okinawensis TaxID=346911 RepID=UPI0039BC6984